MAGAQLLDLGRSMATRLATSEGADAAFLAGSIVVGLGSASSDVDVYLVGTGLRESRRQMLTNGVRIDIQTLATERLAHLVDRVVADYPTPFHGRVANPDLTLAVRLLTGEVITDTGCLTALRDRLAACPLPLRRMVINGWARTAYSAVEDVAGLRESGDQLDRDAAVIAARRALLAAGKALAASCGDLYYGDKWVSHQLARSAPRAFPLPAYRRLMHHDASGPGARDGLTAMVSLVQTCLIAAMTLGWWDVALQYWPAWTDENGPLRRAAFSLPCSSDDVMLIVGLGTQVFRVPPEVLLIWGLCNGASTERVAGEAVALGPLAKPWSRITGRQCHAILRELADAALITGAHV